MGKCIIILGEGSGGCTFPYDYFMENNVKGYDTCEYKVPGPASFVSEHISINTRLSDNIIFNDK